MTESWLSGDRGGHSLIFTPPLDGVVLVDPEYLKDRKGKSWQRIRAKGGSDSGLSLSLGWVADFGSGTLTLRGMKMQGAASAGDFGMTREAL